MAKLYVLCGASGCGKTTLMNKLAATCVSEVTPEIPCVRAPKYSERPRRDSDPNAIDDIIHVPHISTAKFNVAYAMNHTKYGLKFAEIESLLDKDLSCFVIISDIRSITEIKAYFGDRAKAIYVSSAIDEHKLKRIQEERLGFKPDQSQQAVLSKYFIKLSAGARLGWWERVSECIQELVGEWQSYATDAKSTEIRSQRIRTSHIKYIEHIHLFDHVILNYNEGNPNEMTLQMRNIVLSDSCSNRSRPCELPPIFVVSAASGVGKGVLMEMLNLIGTNKIRIVSKLAKREWKPEDKIDGMIALKRGPDAPAPDWPEWWNESMIKTALSGEFPAEYDIRWNFRGKDYAVAKSEIQFNLDNSKSQIMISNMGQIELFRSLWPNNVAFIYLHRLISAQEHRAFIESKWTDDPSEARRRIDMKTDVHNDFMKHIAEFHHVLLNTSFEEDLYEQMFNILRGYSNGQK